MVITTTSIFHTHPTQCTLSYLEQCRLLSLGSCRSARRSCLPRTRQLWPDRTPGCCSGREMHKQNKLIYCTLLKFHIILHEVRTHKNWLLMQMIQVIQVYRRDFTSLLTHLVSPIVHRFWVVYFLAKPMYHLGRRPDDTLQNRKGGEWE